VGLIVVENPQSIKNRWAFLVGINEYDDSGHFPKLKFCRNDVTALRDLLEQVSYTVTCLHDDLSRSDRLFPSHRKIREQLKNFCEDVDPNDLLLVYFACHGTRQGDGKPRLVAADTYSDETESFITVAEVEEQMRSSGSERLVLMLDACHIGVGTDARNEVLADPEFIHNVYELAKGFALIAASTSQESAFEYRGHGVFSHHVLAGLRESRLSLADPNQNFVTVGSLQRYVLHRLKQWRNKHGYSQKPQRRADGDLGEMILVDYREHSLPDLPDSQQEPSGAGSSSAARGGDCSPQISSTNQVLVQSLKQRRQRIVQQLEAETVALNAASGGEVIRRQDAWDAIARQLKDIDDQLRGFEDDSRQ
jgi:uncharacterized caspase-like protein